MTVDRPDMPDEFTGFLNRTELLFCTDRVFRRRLLAEGQHTIGETLKQVRAA